MLPKIVYAVATVLIGAPMALAQETQAPAGSELAEPYDPFTDEDAIPAPATPAPTEEPDLFEVPRPSSRTGEPPEPTMLEPDAGVQPLDIPQSEAVEPVRPELDIDENMLQGSPVDIPSREQVVPTPDATREQVPGVTN